MVNSISQAAGISAQEKRNKSQSGHDSLPPRPPSRRGHRPPAALNAAGLVAPALHLFHTALPAQPLPGELTLAQLYVMLQVRGYNAAQTFFQFKMKLRSKLIEESSGTALIMLNIAMQSNIYMFCITFCLKSFFSGFVEFKCYVINVSREAVMAHDV